MLGASATAVSVLMAVLGAIAALFKGHDTVQEGSYGLIFRFGAIKRDKFGAPVIIKPGWVWLFPFRDKLKHMNVSKRQVETGCQAIQLEDGLTYEVEAYVSFRVLVPLREDGTKPKTANGLYYAYAELGDDVQLDDWVRAQLSIIVGECICVATSTQSRLEISQTISRRSSDFFSPFGLEIIECGLQTYGPTAVTQWTTQTSSKVQDGPGLPFTQSESDSSREVVPIRRI